MRRRLTQQQIILKTLRFTNEWTPSHDLQKVDTPFGWLGTSADRECRRLVEMGKIERKYGKRSNGTRVALYRAKQPIRFEIWRVPALNKIIKTPIYDEEV